MEKKEGSINSLRVGLVVTGVTVLSVFGPFFGIQPSIIAIFVVICLILLTIDSASLNGMGGHIVAEALPGGEKRIKRIAVHEAGHLLIAQEEKLPVKRVLVGTLACINAGLSCNGVTEFFIPESIKMPLEDLRKWSKVLQAGTVAEDIIYGGAKGGSDDKVILSRLWGISGHDIDTAQREQRRARREIEKLLNEKMDDLENKAFDLLASAPRLGK